MMIGIGPDFLDVAGLDMVEGTPVLDVKPYIPYDIVPSNIEVPMLTWADSAATDSQSHSHSYLGADSGTIVGNTTITTSIDLEPRRLLRVPKWIYEADIPLRKVTVTDEVTNHYQSLHKESILTLTLTMIRNHVITGYGDFAPNGEISLLQTFIHCEACLVVTHTGTCRFKYMFEVL